MRNNSKPYLSSSNSLWCSSSNRHSQMRQMVLIRITTTLRSCKRTQMSKTLMIMLARTRTRNSQICNNKWSTQHKLNKLCYFNNTNSSLVSHHKWTTTLSTKRILWETIEEEPKPTLRAEDKEGLPIEFQVWWQVLVQDHMGARREPTRLGAHWISRVLFLSVATLELDLNL